MTSMTDLTKPRPQDDYFLYVNKTWIDANPIPASESSWGTFYVLRDKAWKAVGDIVQVIRSTDATTLDNSQGLLRSFFDAAFAFDTLKEAHAQTIQRELDKITAINDLSGLASYLGYAHRHDINSFWGLFVGLDDKNSQLQVLHVYQGGLSLPNRDYYLDDTDEMKKVRSSYGRYRKKLQSLQAGLGSHDMAAVMTVETTLAKAAWTNVELRDVEKNYNRYSLETLKNEFTGFDWDMYFQAIGWQSPSDNLVVSQPSYLAACLSLMQTEPIENIRSYLAWKLVNGFAAWTSQATLDASFDFYGKAIEGTKEQKPLWKRAVMMADSYVIGEALGKQYAAQFFPETSKQAVLSLVEDIRSVYHSRIDNLEWMHEPTKERAHAKLDNLKVFIGYPSIWRDLSGLELGGDNVLENVLRLRAFDSDHDLAKVGQPPAAEEWEMNAHTVNAYHHPNRLEIVFPAAILQPPFFDPAASYATNLGGIGAVIGHELTHGFDDQGAQFDEHGNVEPWQSAEERAEFDKRAELIVKQADAFETVPGTYLQGKLVLGEAIADIGGLQLAVTALEASEQENGSITELFENFARAECGHATDERLLQLAKVDPHPPSPFRVNAVVNHIDAFYDSYDVAETDKLYRAPKDRAQIW